MKLTNNVLVNDYKELIKMTAIDPFTVYYVFRKHINGIGISVDELNKMTPNWILAKYKLLYDEGVESE